MVPLKKVFPLCLAAIISSSGWYPLFLYFIKIINTAGKNSGIFLNLDSQPLTRTPKIESVLYHGPLRLFL